MLKRQYYITFGLVLLVTLVVLTLPEQTAGKLKLAVGGLFLPLFGMAGAAQQLVEQAGNTLAPEAPCSSRLKTCAKKTSNCANNSCKSRRPGARTRNCGRHSSGSSAFPGLSNSPGSSARTPPIGGAPSSSMSASARASAPTWRCSPPTAWSDASQKSAP